MPHSARLAALGDFLRRYRRPIAVVQWAMVAVYLFLLVGPFLAGSAPGSSFAALPRYTEAVFWGLWWPGVLLSVMVFGQFWCGLLCPDGTVTEAVSRYGRGLKPAAWMTGAPWLPLALFAALTLIADSFEAHGSPVGNLLSVGGVSVMAVLIGLGFGRGKRIWCRYLCPMGGLFSVLTRCSVVHFKVDRARWDAAPKQGLKPVDCPLLLDVRRLVSTEKCNMCGRCSGYRQAVALSPRAPGAEIARITSEDARLWEAFGICYVLIGLAHAGAIAHGDMAAILAFGLTFGTIAAVTVVLAAWGDRALVGRLAYGLIPLGGLGLFLAAVGHAAVILAGQDLSAPTILAVFRAAILSLGVAWSAALIRPLTASLPPRRRRWGNLVMTTGTVILGLTFFASPYLIRG